MSASSEIVANRRWRKNFEAEEAAAVREKEVVVVVVEERVAKGACPATSFVPCLASGQI